MKDDKMAELTKLSLDRRRLLQSAGLGGLALALGARSPLMVDAQETQLDELVIDLAAEPPSLDPALVYDIDGWSVVHSIHDALYQYSPEGELEPLLAAELPNPIDATTYEIKLRPGLTFHNGEPVNAASIALAVQHITAEETASQVADQFRVITEVKQIDDLTVHLILSAPTPSLPSQMPSWLAPLPVDYAASNDFGSKPIGAGPFVFVEWKPGESITVEANPNYPEDSPKGKPIAKRVTFRIVPEASTRVADLLAGTADLVRSVPLDQVQEVQDGGAKIEPVPVSAVTFIRIATDTAPFSDIRVRQALNYAVDVDTIVAALYGGNGQRLPNLFPPGGLGFNADLAPYPYDPEKAKALLTEAGFADGFETTLAHTVGERADLAEAIAGQLAEVGINAKVQAQENAVFNGEWKDTAAPPLRAVSWRPLFDPSTLLSLVVSNQGFLSRYSSDTVQPILDQFLSEIDAEKRAALAVQLGQALFDDPAAIYLFNLSSVFGVAERVPEWTARADDSIIPTFRG
jgi:peptide/nickel transport system substrate-binding protein